MQRVLWLTNKKERKNEKEKKKENDKQKQTNKHRQNYGQKVEKNTNKY